MRPFVWKVFDGKTFAVRNMDFLAQFFPASLPTLQLEKVEAAVTRKKSAGTCRIFVLGESAAEGWPGPSFGFPRHLRLMLEARYPGVSFEVVKLCFRAINSHVIKPTAHLCAAELDPDVFVVYLGQ